MTRPLDPATAAAVSAPVLPLAALVRLDIKDDPLFAWSGIGDLVFAAGQTGDSALDTFTFKGLGTLIEVSTASDGVGGSDALDVGFPGVDLTQPLLLQLMTNRNRWQFRRAWVWLMALNPDTDAIAGKPFRIKTGRMDQMPLSEDDNGGSVRVRIEGQQAYGNTPLATRYSQQFDINPLDTSQKWVWSLANMTANLGQASAQPGTSGTPGGAGAAREVVGRAINSIL